MEEEFDVFIPVDRAQRRQQEEQNKGYEQYQLRQNLQALEAITMPKPEIFVGNADAKFDKSGTLTDETTRKFLEAWLKAFGEWVKKVGG